MPHSASLNLGHLQCLPWDTPSPRGVPTVIIPTTSLPLMEILKVISHQGYPLEQCFKISFNSSLFLLINLTQSYIQSGSKLNWLWFEWGLRSHPLLRIADPLAKTPSLEARAWQSN